MAGVDDVEALLDSAAKEKARGRLERDEDDIHRSERNGRRDRDRSRSSSRDRKRRDRSSDRDRRDRNGDRHVDSPRKDRDRDRRSEGRHRTRSKSGDRDEGRHYRPSGRRDRDDKSRGHGRDKPDERRRSSSLRRKSPTPPPTEEERDKRTVFVQQLAARLRTKELIQFFEKIGPVKEAQIVKDRISGRSKGVGYVEFRHASSVPPAVALTGQKLLGIPIIAQLTEAEKNRLARPPVEVVQPAPPTAPFHRLYVGNIHFSITESDLQNVFEPFGELEFVSLQKEDGGRSRGYGFVQFRDPNQARDALEKMNGFDLAGRPIRVGLGNDKFTAESTASLLQRFHEDDDPDEESERPREREKEREKSREQSRERSRERDRDRDRSRDRDRHRERDSDRDRERDRDRDRHRERDRDRDRDRERDRDRDRERDRDRDRRGDRYSNEHSRGYDSYKPGDRGGNHDRANSRDDGRSGKSAAPEDTNTAGNYGNVSRTGGLQKSRNEQSESDYGRRQRREHHGRGAASAMMSMASRCILLKNMFDPAEEDSDTWVRDLEEDVRAECESKYGPVVHIALDENSDGDIFLKFKDAAGGENAIRGLNGRYFGGRQISATPVVDAIYSSQFPKTKGL